MSRTKQQSINRAILAVVIILLGIGVAVLLKLTAKKATQRPPREYVGIVVTQPLKKIDTRIEMDLTGSVEAAKLVDIKAQVSGTVLETAAQFIPGGRFSDSETFLNIDPADYRITTASRAADLASAEAAMQLEMGQQEIARQEWEMNDWKANATEADANLALRKPYLQQAKAKLDAAKAAKERAVLDLARCEISAPFDAVVVERYVQKGSLLSMNSPVAQIAGTENFWVRATIAVDRLNWLPTIDRLNAYDAKIYPRNMPEASRKGRIIRRMAQLEEAGRLAQLLIEVPTPLEGEYPLLLGSYVRIKVQGRELTDVFSIPREAVHDSDYIYLMKPDRTLEIRKIAPLWRGRSRILVTEGLKDGELLVTNELPSPINGMSLRHADEEPPAAPEAPKNKNGKKPGNIKGEK